MLVAAVAMPAYVCAASATPVAAVLLLKGISPGAVLVGLLLGPATNVATLGVLKEAYGGRSVLIGTLGIALATIGIGYAVNANRWLPLHCWAKSMVRWVITTHI